MTTAGYAAAAQAEICRVFDDPTLTQLADRIEEVLDLLDADPGHWRLRQNRMQSPKLWLVAIHGSGRDFVILWDYTDAGQPWIHYAGDAF